MLQLKNTSLGVPVLAQRLMNPTSIHEDACSIPGSAQWVKLCSDCRCGLNSALLWLWCRLAAAALI